MTAKSDAWLSIFDPDVDAHPHVMPIDDLRPHTGTCGCWCRPTPDDNIMVHHSMDRREEYEQGRKLS